MSATCVSDGTGTEKICVC